MSIPKKLYLHDGDYHMSIINGKYVKKHYKNVYIMDIPIGSKVEPQVFIPLRIYKETEKDDMLLAKILTQSVEKYHKSKTHGKTGRPDKVES
jgi:hypothetical protein